VVDGSADKKLSPKLPSYNMVCVFCIVEADLFCRKHSRYKRAVYDNSLVGESEYPFFSVCIDCVKDALDEMTVAQARQYVEQIARFEPSLPDQFADVRLFGAPTEPCFDRRVIYNVLVWAHMNKLSLEQEIGRLRYVVEEARSAVIAAPVVRFM
jgi:hypothetical protein